MRLVTLIKHGAQQQTRLAFDALRLLDGGNLEDVTRVLADLATDDPKLLLEQLKAHGWEPERIESLVRMLPLETVDQPDERLRLIRERLVSLRRVHDMRLATVRDVAIAALQKYEAQLGQK